MSRSERTVPAWFAIAAVVVLLGAGALFAVSGASMAEAKGGDTILTVTVAPSDPSSGGTGSGGGSVSADELVAPDGTVTPAPSASAAAASESALFSVSSLRATHEWTANPLDSRVRLTLTVRNGSKSTIDASVGFRMTTSFGNIVGSATGISIDGLKPGKSRVITESIAGLGQWTLLNASATVTPPKKVDGQVLKPIVRDASVLVPSTLVAGGGGLIVAGGASAAIWFARRPLGLLFGGA